MTTTPEPNEVGEELADEHSFSPIAGQGNIYTLTDDGVPSTHLDHGSTLPPQQMQYPWAHSSKPFANYHTLSQKWQDGGWSFSWLENQYEWGPGKIVATLSILHRKLPVICLDLKSVDIWVTFQGQHQIEIREEIAFASLDNKKIYIIPHPETGMRLVTTIPQLWDFLGIGNSYRIPLGILWKAVKEVTRRELALLSSSTAQKLGVYEFSFEVLSRQQQSKWQGTNATSVVLGGIHKGRLSYAKLLGDYIVMEFTFQNIKSVSIAAQTTDDLRLSGLEFENPHAWKWTS